jgi:alanyl-tRNA synthetase
MGGDSEKITAYHTITHLLLAGLKKFVGENVSQRGSNITEERARFDFNNDEKVQKDVQEKIEN